MPKEGEKEKKKSDPRRQFGQPEGKPAGQALRKKGKGQWPARKNSFNNFRKKTVNNGEIGYVRKIRSTHPGVVAGNTRKKRAWQCGKNSSPFWKALNVKRGAKYKKIGWKSASAGHGEAVRHQKAKAASIHEVTRRGESVLSAVVSLRKADWGAKEAATTVQGGKGFRGRGGRGDSR